MAGRYQLGVAQEVRGHSLGLKGEACMPLPGGGRKVGGHRMGCREVALLTPSQWHLHGMSLKATFGDNSRPRLCALGPGR